MEAAGPSEYSQQTCHPTQCKNPQKAITWTTPAFKTWKHNVHFNCNTAVFVICAAVTLFMSFFQSSYRLYATHHVVCYHHCIQMYGTLNFCRKNGAGKLYKTSGRFSIHLRSPNIHMPVTT